MPCSAQDTSGRPARAQSAAEYADQLRPPANDTELRRWLEIALYHRFTPAEIEAVTGVPAEQLPRRLEELQLDPDRLPPPPDDRLMVLPYPGGRHPRIGFLDGAVAPQRETKLSVFAPWDASAYAVLDIPEAIWSNLGLTYLAHTHVPTIWTEQNIVLPKLEWQPVDGGYRMVRRLPNGIEFGTRAVAHRDHVELWMWLYNGTDRTLSDLRVQNCVLLRGLPGFTQQSNENKLFRDGYAVAHSPDRQRWVISAWDPVHRAWGNARCPCLHSDPKFPDCPPGQTRWLRGWFSFYQGTDIDRELARIERTGWRDRPVPEMDGNLRGRVLDGQTGETLPCRLYVQRQSDGRFFFVRSQDAEGTAIVYDKQRFQRSIERHTSLSPHPFVAQLPPGDYRITAELGKEYLPTTVAISVAEDPVDVQLELHRLVEMKAHGWYSGDTHVHRTVDELPVVMQAEDLNVALPLTYWVRDSQDKPVHADPPPPANIIEVSPDHLIYPVNTEYEIFTVDGRRHTLGAVFVLGHSEPLSLAAPPLEPIAAEARRQGALLDLDKHSWNWSLMAVPVMSVDLFELSNNHHWRTEFGFTRWTLEHAPPDWPEITIGPEGFSEASWTEFGLQTYYALLNCGFRMRVSAGTASGVHPVPLGYGRVYVHVGQGTLHFDAWKAALDAGRSFVTQGPLMQVRFDDQLPGTTWTRSESQSAVSVTGEIQSARPLSRIEVVRNGEIAVRIRPANHPLPDGGYR
ncbi:MAG: hypothetical protein D6753_08545, partial [Planctomycetota bacterium]